MRKLYLDADACPVKEEAYRVAARHGLETLVVTCQAMRDPERPAVRLVTVKEGPDLADDWIADNIQAGDVCVTDDIPLAGRCIQKGARVVTARGRQLHAGNIGETLATRNLLEELRSHGTLPEGIGGGPAPFTKRDRSRFLEQMEETLRALLREPAPPGSAIPEQPAGADLSSD